MPFDSSNEIRHNQSIISHLMQQADEALEACERNACVALIQQIYELLDLASAARCVVPDDMRTRTALIGELAVVEVAEQHH